MCLSPFHPLSLILLVPTDPDCKVQDWFVPQPVQARRPSQGRQVFLCPHRGGEREVSGKKGKCRNGVEEWRWRAGGEMGT